LHTCTTSIGATTPAHHKREHISNSRFSDIKKKPY
jgi:hypothetical protein